MDFLEKWLKSLSWTQWIKSPSLIHGSDGLFGKMFKKSITSKSPSLAYGSDGLFEKVHHWQMEEMDLLEKCSRSPSLTCWCDGLFGKMYKRSITDTWEWWTFWKNVQKVHHWHMEVMDFWGKCWKSPSLADGSDGLLRKVLILSIIETWKWKTLQNVEKPVVDTLKWWTFWKIFKKSIIDTWIWKLWTFWEMYKKCITDT